MREEKNMAARIEVSKDLVTTGEPKNSYAYILLTCRAISLPQREERLRDKPKECRLKESVCVGRLLTRDIRFLCFIGNSPYKGNNLLVYSD